MCLVPTNIDYRPYVKTFKLYNVILNTIEQNRVIYVNINFFIDDIYKKIDRKLDYVEIRNYIDDLSNTHLIYQNPNYSSFNLCLTPFGQTLYNKLFKYNDYNRTNKLIQNLKKFHDKRLY